MLNFKKIIFLIIMAFGLIACAAEENAEEDVDDTFTGSTEINGTYAFTADRTTEFDVNGDACALNAAGTLTINGSSVTGAVEDSDGLKYALNGTIETIALAYIAEGTFVANDNTNLGEFTGLFGGSMPGGSGTYEDVFECQGVWNATK